MKIKISKFAIKDSAILNYIKGGIKGKDLPCAIDPGKVSNSGSREEDSFALTIDIIQ